LVQKYQDKKIISKCDDLKIWKCFIS